MNEPTHDLQADVAQIIADAIAAAAEGLGRWLEQPIEAVQIVTLPSDVPGLESTVSQFGRETCRCVMRVKCAFSTTSGAEHAAPPAAAVSAGKFLLAWEPDEAAWLLDHSLSEVPESRSLQDSALAETCNIVGCEFLNRITNRIRSISHVEVTLTPSPPHVCHPFDGDTVSDAIDNLGEHHDGAPWFAAGLLQSPGEAASTRIAMVWCPDVWDRLSRLVDGPADGPIAEPSRPPGDEPANGKDV